MSTTALKLTTDTYLENTALVPTRITNRAAGAFHAGAVRIALVRTAHGLELVLAHVAEVVEGEIASIPSKE